MQGLRFFHSFRPTIRSFATQKAPPVKKGRYTRRVLVLSALGIAGALGFELYQRVTGNVQYEEQWITPAVLQAHELATRRLLSLLRLFTEPPVEKLLPDVNPPPGYSARRTLVLNTRGTIIKASYVQGKGFEITKRPGLTAFLNRVSQIYEVVLFGDDENNFAVQLYQHLDPKRTYFTTYIGHEGLSYRFGGKVKDLKYLNRDLKDLIIIENNPQIVRLHPQNVILLSDFTGNEGDSALTELLPFLEHVVNDHVQDIRDELDKWGHVDTGKRYISHEFRQSLRQQS